MIIKDKMSWLFCMQITVSKVAPKKYVKSSEENMHVDIRV